MTQQTGDTQVEYPVTYRRVLNLFRPYFRQLILLAVVSVFLSVITSASQVALTPIAQVVLEADEGTQITSAAQACSIDLDDLGGCMLGVASDLTGQTNRWNLLLIVSIIYLAIALFGQAASFGAHYWAQYIRFHMSRDLEDRIFSHLLSLPMAFFDRHQIGWLQSRMTKDTVYANRQITDFIINGISSSLLSVFYAVLLIATDPLLTLVACVAGAAHMVLSNYLGKLLKRTIREDFGLSARVQAYIQERLSAVREIKALAAERIEQAAMYNHLIDKMWAGLKHNIAKRVEAPVRWSINRLVIIAVMLFGALRVFQGSLSVSGFLLFMFFSQSLIAPLSRLAEMFVAITELRGALEQVIYILDRKPEPDGEQPVEGFEHAIELQDVSFHYVEGLPVLQNINLTINKGEMVALVGRSGSGKTTLVDLILRFYLPRSGRILLDSTPIDGYRLADYRRLFGVVSQDSTLLDESVRENIAYARSELTLADVERAAQVANAEAFILNDLADGYDTRLGERGVILSGGQKQRITIARAVAHKPPLLILDEATSALDSESERKVQQAIDEVVRGSTAIVIAHRLSTVRRAHKIVVLRDGRILEQGTHDELLALGGEYYHLHEQQFFPAEDRATSPAQV